MAKSFETIMRERRIEKNITQTHLAQAIGKSPQLICDIENGRKSPGRSTLISIARELDISLDNIFLY